MTTRSRVFNGLTYKTAGSFTNMTIDEQDAKLSNGLVEATLPAKSIVLIQLK